jgi:hypothetical protein
MPVVESPRPFDPDDLPIVAAQTDEERAWVEALPDVAFAPGGGVLVAADDVEETPVPATLEPKPFLLKTLAARLRRTE